MESSQLLSLVNGLVVMILCLTVHEFSHAAVARWLGDDTAERQHRLTLDPRAHIDVFGTLVLPALGALSGIPLIGWARPVPTDPRLYRRRLMGSPVGPGLGHALVALAGPLSNLAFALVLATLWGLGMRFFELSQPAMALLRTGTSVNLSLAVLNLIPLPPLDGSRVVAWLLPQRLRPEYERLGGMTGYLVLMALMFTGVFGSLLRPVFETVGSLVKVLAGV
jgi:Zn-dependent protease